MTFSAQILRPENGVEIQWIVNGARQQGETEARFVLDPVNGETYDIAIRLPWFILGWIRATIW